MYEWVNEAICVKCYEYSVRKVLYKNQSIHMELNYLYVGIEADRLLLIESC